MENTPRNVIVQIGGLIALYLSVSFFLTLVFGLINLAYPDTADTYYDIEGASDSVRLGIAMLTVFFPTYIALTRITHTIRRKDSTSELGQLTKWLIYLTLLIAGLVLLGTLVMTLYTFLNGDITSRFIMKAATVLGVVGMSFHYYLLEAKGYWIKHESRSFMFAVGASLVVILALAFGFGHIETPATVRDMKLDEQQLNDLRNIQWQIENYYSMSSGTLPTTLEDAYKESGAAVPVAPDGRTAYRYKQTEKGFELCAAFSRDSADTGMTPPLIDPKAIIKNSENWNYKAGDYCFERTVK
jgi:Domain of unknown function (DUF5671)